MHVLTHTHSHTQPHTATHNPSTSIYTYTYTYIYIYYTYTYNIQLIIRQWFISSIDDVITFPYWLPIASAENIKHRVQHPHTHNNHPKQHALSPSPTLFSPSSQSHLSRAPPTHRAWKLTSAAPVHTGSALPHLLAPPLPPHATLRGLSCHYHCHCCWCWG